MEKNKDTLLTRGVCVCVCVCVCEREESKAAQTKLKGCGINGLIATLLKKGFPRF